MYLTTLLLESLRAGKPSRVINVSGRIYEHCKRFLPHEVPHIFFSFSSMG